MWRMPEAIFRCPYWTAGGCKSWFLNDNGHNADIRPRHAHGFRSRTPHLEPAERLSQRQPTPAGSRANGDFTKDQSMRRSRWFSAWL